MVVVVGFVVVDVYSIIVVVVGFVAVDVVYVIMVVVGGGGDVDLVDAAPAMAACCRSLK
jgi:hypothetical protein